MFQPRVFRTGTFAIATEMFRLAVASLRNNKLRTLLTLLGVIVGVSAVIAVVTIINGLDQTVASTFSSQGSTVFTVSKRPLVITSREDFIKFNRRKDVTKFDADAIQRLCSLCWRISYSVNGRQTVRYGENVSDNVPIRGTTLSTFDIDALVIEAGRTWTEMEEKSAQNVAVIGADLLKNVFNGASAEQVIGNELRVGGREYRIVGTVTPMGNVLGISRDNFVLIPYETGIRVFGANDSLVISVQVENSSLFDDAKEQAGAIMRSRRGKILLTTTDGNIEEDEGFSVESQDVFIGLYKTATDNIYIVTIGVAAISLVVGGIVVMNIMLVSVTERTREIGLRKAVGAKASHILGQFLIEAVVLTSVGGLIGVFAGFFLAVAIALIIGFPTLISVWAMILGVGVSTTVGVISGLYPAWKASKLSPVDAMRRE